MGSPEKNLIPDTPLEKNNVDFMIDEVVEISDEMNKTGNLEVTICELLPHRLQLAFDVELCMEAEKLLEQRGVKILADQKVTSTE